MSAKIRIDPKDCDHANPEIMTVPEIPGWEVTFVRCKCRLRGQGWSFSSKDGAGRNNAEIMARNWWENRMTRVPSPHLEDFMSPRDEFAKAAMQGEFSALADPDSRGMGDWNKLAVRAYECADAMMLARKGGAA